ncbi:MAG TPA: hypothetical protein VFO25_08055 [Candidatus Eremiobacteraceae bacterium]|nr:hypothetical protein [Candidatus Eremiobacteraceae bacterium]
MTFAPKGRTLVRRTASQVKNRDANLAVVAGAVTLALAVLPMAWILLEKVLGLEPPDVAELGAIAGAIFTAGGLVIAIVSIYSMINVQKIARNEVDRLLGTLSRQFGERLQTYLRAFDRFLAARSVSEHLGFDDMSAIEHHIRRALEIDKELVGARRWIGDMYYTIAGSQFLEQHRGRTITNPSGATAASAAADVSRAINWLVEARAYGDGDEVEATARLAELYGMTGGFEREMFSCVSSVVASGRPQSFEHNSSRAFLVAGCKDEKSVRDLAELLGATFPWRREDLDREWQAFVHGDLAIHGATTPAPTIWVLPRGRRRLDDPKGPGEVRLLPHRDGVGIRATWVTMFQVPGQNVRHGGIPSISYDSNGTPTEAPEPPPAEEVFSELLDRFHVIGRSESSRFPERGIELD